MHFYAGTFVVQIALHMAFVSLYSVRIYWTLYGSTTAGSKNYSITCMVHLTGLMVTPTIQWMDPTSMNISHNDSDFTVGPLTGSGITYSRELMFKSLNISVARMYTCSVLYDVLSDMATTSITVKSMHFYVM